MTKSLHNFKKFLGLSTSTFIFVLLFACTPKINTSGMDLAPSSNTISNDAPSIVTPVLTPVQSNSPTKLALSGPANVAPSECIKYSINLLDDNNLPVSTQASVTATLAGSEAGSFYLSSTCTGTSINSITISTGMQSSVVYYKKLVVAKAVVTLQANGLSSASISVTTLGDGSSGALTVLAPNTIVNSYTWVTSATLPSGSLSISVNSSTNFQVGAQILIIQMQHSVSPLSVGVFEFATISAITGNILTLSQPLLRSYSSGTFDSTASMAAQVVLVPQYSSVAIGQSGSIVAPPWNGKTGGIIALKSSNTMRIDGAISSSALGYRGGAGTPSLTAGFALAGESLTGIGSNISEMPNFFGGGPGGCMLGGGSAFAGQSGAGGTFSSIGGQNPGGGTTSGSGITAESSASNKHSLGIQNFGTLLLGSAGGGGAGSGADAAQPGGAGGAGGGIIFIEAQSILLNGSVLSNGQAGTNQTGPNGGGGGGGAGGTIYISAENLATIDMSKIGVFGGSGGAGSASNGGAGGQGIIKLGLPTSGDLVVSTSNQVVNDYSSILDASVPAGATSLNLADSAYFSAGDQVLIIQMQTPAGNAGTFEFATIQSITGNLITISSALKNSFVSGSFNSVSPSAAQLVRVPNFSSVTVNIGASLTAKPWDGVTGGVLAFLSSGGVVVNGGLNVNGTGFRGGNSMSPANNQSGNAGESTSGLGSPSSLSNQGSGGGGSASGKAGGGGGGYGTIGLVGQAPSGTGGAGGGMVGTFDLSTLRLGTGGGGGAASAAAYGGEGGTGGGIIYVQGASILINGSVSAQGLSGNNGTGGKFDTAAGGGGGSGGSILLKSNGPLNVGNTLVTSLGGAAGIGFANTQSVGNGGSGGKGRVKLSAVGIISGASDPVSP